MFFAYDIRYFAERDATVFVTSLYYYASIGISPVNLFYESSSGCVGLGRA